MFDLWVSGWCIVCSCWTSSYTDSLSQSQAMLTIPVGRYGLPCTCIINKLLILLFGLIDLDQLIPWNDSSFLMSIILMYGRNVALRLWQIRRAGCLAVVI